MLDSCMVRVYNQMVYQIGLETDAFVDSILL